MSGQVRKKKAALQDAGAIGRQKNEKAIRKRRVERNAFTSS